jgi:hypothetical protein
VEGVLSEATVARNEVVAMLLECRGEILSMEKAHAIKVIVGRIG